MFVSLISTNFSKLQLNQWYFPQKVFRFIKLNSTGVNQTLNFVLSQSCFSNMTTKIESENSEKSFNPNPIQQDWFNRSVNEFHQIVQQVN